MAKKEVYQIGKSSDNDIILSHSTISSRHALLEKKQSGWFLTDTSTNGTQVNGKSIPKEFKVPVSAKDKIIFAGVEALDWKLVGESSSNFSFPVVNVLTAALFFLGVSTAGFYFYKDTSTYEDSSECSPEGDVYKLPDIARCYNDAVVIIFHLYYYTLDYEGEKQYIGIDADGDLSMNTRKDRLNPMAAAGTGFFISTDGKIITNRHVALPWRHDEKIKPIIERRYPGISFNGESTFMSVAINGTAYESTRDALEFDEVQVVQSHNIEKVDLALLQTKSKNLPTGTSHINIENKILINSDSTRQGAIVLSLGFPGGFLYATTDYTINSSTYDGTVQQEPGDYILKCNMPSAGGASGSPVFNEQGQIIGVLTQGYGTNLGNYMGCMHAKFILDLL